MAEVVLSRQTFAPGRYIHGPVTIPNGSRGVRVLVQRHTKAAGVVVPTSRLTDDRDAQSRQRYVCRVRVEISLDRGTTWPVWAYTDVYGGVYVNTRTGEESEFTTIFRPIPAGNANRRVRVVFDCNVSTPAEIQMEFV